MQVKIWYNRSERLGDFMKFTQIPLHQDIYKALDKLDYHEMFPVQEKVIGKLLQNKDMIVKSKTGSGKTAAFVIPLISNIEWEQKEPQALILAPTRELALQIKEETDLISTYRRLKTVAIFGKQPYKQQILDLKQRTHIVVGTPGRILDHIEKGTLSLSSIRYVVIDEADEMLKMGFIEKVSTIIEHITYPHTTCLFSATMPQQVQDLAQRFLKDAEYVEIQQSQEVNEQVHHYAYQVKEKEKMMMLEKVLVKQRPETAIIFANTQEKVKDICDRLYDLGISVDKIHGGMLQEDRIQNMKDFKRGSIRILVATDVAARGLDIQDISLIINYDMPWKPETYIHRVGRAGRANTTGTAISFINEYDEIRLQELETFIKQSLVIKDSYELLDMEVTKEDFLSLGTEIQQKEEKGKELTQEKFKLYIGGGKAKKIRAGDIVGAICEIDGVNGEDIGVIQVQEHQTYVDILNGKGLLVLEALQHKMIKKKKLRVEQAIEK